MFEGLLGLLVLIADVWAILNVFQSSESTGSKALWIVLVLVLPVLRFRDLVLCGPQGQQRLEARGFARRNRGFESAPRFVGGLRDG